MEAWSAATHEVTKSDWVTKLKDLNYHDGVVSHLEPDILECEDQVSLKKLLQTKPVEGMEFQLSYFKI